MRLRRSIGRIAFVGAGAACIIGALAQSAAGMIEPVSQTRQVSASSDAVDFLGDNPQQGMQSAPGFDAFAGDVSAKSVASDPVSGPQGSAMAVQNSSFTGSGIVDDGSVTADSFTGTGLSASASAVSSFSATFDVDKTQTLNLLESVSIPIDTSSPSSNEASLSIVSAGGASVFGPVIVNSSLDQNLALTLAPGRYVFAFEATSISSDETFNSIGYQVSMTALSQPVPLPNAATAGAAMLIMLGILRNFTTPRRAELNSQTYISC